MKIFSLPLLSLAAVTANPANAAPQVQSSIEARAEGEVAKFYSARNFRPLWLNGAQPSAAASRLLRILEKAELDGMNAARSRAWKIEEALEAAASGDEDSAARAELLLSQAWVEYVQTLKRPADVGMIYADPSLAPRAPTAAQILEAAASARSLDRHVDQVAKVNPVYAQLREALAALQEGRGSDLIPLGKSTIQAERALRMNMERARAIPADQKGKFILVDAASEKLWMYEDGQVAGSMRVIVGKPTEQTPMIASTVRSAVLNPYWNVPVDLVQKRIAPAVLSEGFGYLRAKKYEILSDWTENAQVVDPATVDWAAVAAGRKELRVRQLPGNGNMMGDMKFMFPNEFGVYLHDTPDKSLFTQAARKLSSGCVRVEDAPRLARWLFGTMPRANSSAPEQVVELGSAVPVYITYLTVGVEGQSLAFRQDVYGRDRQDSRRYASMAGDGGN
ncbi:MAG TPA: L,D-transpeptidase family protein [Allosphingosinicella sp.]|nr:L,D-transpeptidase family protein [Allosphingosinicella sp.]